MNRRTFFQASILTLGALVGYSALSQAEERRRGAKPTSAASAGAQLVNPNDPAAKAVNYVNKNSDIKDAKIQTERSGVKFKDQKCSNCVFYVKDKEATASGKKAAPCQMPFATGKVVVADGWCNSWAKKG